MKTGCNRFKAAVDTPCKYASFAPILKKNRAELNILWPKQYAAINSDFHDNSYLCFFEMYKIIFTIIYL